MLNNNEIQEGIKEFGLNNDSKFRKIPNGINSNVYIINDNSDNYILKFYRVDNNIPTRLEREVCALKLFQENGINNVPVLLNYSKELNCSLLSYISGENISTFSEDYIVHFQSFYKKILSLSKTVNKESLSLNAIDCCLEIDTVNKQIISRLTKLKEENNPEINELLNQMDDFFKIVENQVNALHNDFNDLKPILSTVDFGINNALFVNNMLHFIDFEFFGWDNPIHLISDTISHPANGLNILQQSALLDALFECYRVKEEKEQIKEAFNGVNLLFDIKWCLIMLNPFLGSYNSNFAQSEIHSRQAVQKNKVIDKVALIKLKMQNAIFFH